jgi:hypothetical protein
MSLLSRKSVLFSSTTRYAWSAFLLGLFCASAYLQPSGAAKLRASRSDQNRSLGRAAGRLDAALALKYVYAGL